MAQAKRELFKSADVCELTQLQPYVLRSWEAEFPGLGRPATAGGGRIYRRPDVDLVLRIKQLVFVEGLTLAGARRRLDEEREASSPTVEAVADDEELSDVARTKLRHLRDGLTAILEMLSREGRAPAELTLVSPEASDARTAKSAAGKRRRAS